eukprot:6815556-Karenia_brevis.AAC.1
MSERCMLGLTIDTIDTQHSEWLATFVGSSAQHYFQQLTEETFDGEHPRPRYIYPDAPAEPNVYSD